MANTRLIDRARDLAASFAEMSDEVSIRDLSPSLRSGSLDTSPAIRAAMDACLAAALEYAGTRWQLIETLDTSTIPTESSALYLGWGIYPYLSTGQEPSVVVMRWSAPDQSWIVSGHAFRPSHWAPKVVGPYGE